MYEAIGIGVSAGGLKALSKIIPALPVDFPLAVIVVQHRIHEQEDFLTSYLNKLADMPVSQARSRETIQPGHVYVAPSGYHLLVERDKTFSLSVDPPVNNAIPAIDVMFQSAASSYRNKFVAVLLTGANQDGSAGMKAVKDLGGFTLVQDPATAEASVMPQAAIDLVAVDRIMALDEIGKFLQELCYSGGLKNDRHASERE